VPTVIAQDSESQPPLVTLPLCTDRSHRSCNAARQRAVRLNRPRVIGHARSGTAAEIRLVAPTGWELSSAARERLTAVFERWASGDPRFTTEHRVAIDRTVAKYIVPPELVEDLVREVVAAAYFTRLQVIS
jgi:dissimilatory sulfite reductase (desulfoviridin) alpha/beta subunit